MFNFTDNQLIFSRMVEKQSAQSFHILGKAVNHQIIDLLTKESSKYEKAPEVNDHSINKDNNKILQESKSKKVLQQSDKKSQTTNQDNERSASLQFQQIKRSSYKPEIADLKKCNDPLNIIESISKLVGIPSIRQQDEMKSYKETKEIYENYWRAQREKHQQQKKKMKMSKIAALRKNLKKKKQMPRKPKTWQIQIGGILPKNQSNGGKNTKNHEFVIIHKENLLNLYKINPSQLVEMQYEGGEGQDQIFYHLFEQIRSEMQLAKIYKLRETNLSKMRTFIVRRILDDYVWQKKKLTEEQKQHLSKQNRRMTRYDRQKYIQAGIPEPPSRMKSQYLKTIFANDEFRDFYLNYIESDKLRSYLFSNNMESINSLQAELSSILKNAQTTEEKLRQFKQLKRKPMFVSQIGEYLQQAAMIRIEYSREKRQIPIPLPDLAIL